MNQRQQGAAEPREDVRSEVARRVISAMEAGEAPWQKPWSAHAFRPANLATGNAYKGINRVLLGLAAAGRSNLFMTYRQAAERGWQVRSGEKGSMIVKLVELDGAQRPGAGEGAGSEGAEPNHARRALRRYFVFNAEQIEGAPTELPGRAEPAFEPIERAELVMQALIEKTGLMVAHGFEPCYIPSTDEVRLPPRAAFAGSGAWGYHSVALHEAAHSTLHGKRLNRREALGARFGEEAYAMEELRAEIAAAILAAETGVPMSEASIANHAGYLRSWVRAIERDPMAIFTAARDAERMAEYLLDLERSARAQRSRSDWVQDYERAEDRALSR